MATEAAGAPARAAEEAAAAAGGAAEDGAAAAGGGGSGEAAMREEDEAAREEEVGIARFVCPDRPGFRGTLKQRYRDFIVREVGLDGEVARLTSQDLPPGFDDEKAADEAPVPEKDEDRVAAGLAALEALAGADVKAKVLALLEDEPAETHVRLPVIDDKAKRTEVHQSVRKFFGPALITDTVSESGTSGVAPKSVVRIIRADAAKTAGNDSNGNKRDAARGDLRGNGDKKRPRVVERWPANVPPFVSFILHKENFEAGAVISHLSFHLNVPAQRIGFAGNKDKRGVTVQRITVHHRRPEAIRRAAETPAKGRQAAQMAVGNFKLVEKGLSLGDQRGNEFELTMRDVKMATADQTVPGPHSAAAQEAQASIETNIELWAKRGFLNYFGMQRFGTYATSTHAVGACVLRGDFQRATRLLFEPSGNSPAFEAAAAEFVKTCAFHKLLVSARGNTTAIRSIVHHIDKDRKKRGITEPKPLESLDDRTLQGAFSRIPHHLRQLYVHAYQAYVFNQLVTKRVDAYGADAVVVGDLVCKRSDQDTIDEAQIKTATQEEIAAGAWTMEDVLLPVPGTKTEHYPSHDVGRSACEAIMAADEVSLADMQKKAGKLAPQGTYRYMLVTPRDVTHRWLYYAESDAGADFLQTDVDRLKGESDPEAAFRSPAADRPRAALVLRFKLGTSCYATMGLRELTKAATDRASVVAK